MSTYRIETKEHETGLMELATNDRFETLDAAQNWVNDFYGPGYKGIRIVILMEENGEAQTVVWHNGVN